MFGCLESKHCIEKSGGTETPEYKDLIAYYQKLADAYSEISIFEMGETDYGNPLHLVVFNADGSTKLDKIKCTITRHKS